MERQPLPGAAAREDQRDNFCFPLPAFASKTNAAIDGLFGLRRNCRCCKVSQQLSKKDRDN